MCILHAKRWPIIIPSFHEATPWQRDVGSSGIPGPTAKQRKRRQLTFYKNASTENTRPQLYVRQFAGGFNLESAAKRIRIAALSIFWGKNWNELKAYNISAKRMLFAFADNCGCAKTRPFYEIIHTSKNAGRMPVSKESVQQQVLFKAFWLEAKAQYSVSD